MGRTECNRIVNFDGGPHGQRLIGQMIDVCITQRCRTRCGGGGWFGRAWPADRRYAPRFAHVSRQFPSRHRPPVVPFPHARPTMR